MYIFIRRNELFHSRWLLVFGSWNVFQNLASLFSIIGLMSPAELSDWINYERSGSEIGAQRSVDRDDVTRLARMNRRWSNSSVTTELASWASYGPYSRNNCSGNTLIAAAAADGKKQRGRSRREEAVRKKQRGRSAFISNLWSHLKPCCACCWYSVFSRSLTRPIGILMCRPSNPCPGVSDHKNKKRCLEEGAEARSRV